MLSDRQLSVLSDRVLNKFIHGIKDDGGELRMPAVIPSPEQFARELSNLLGSKKLGYPFFNAIHQKRKITTH